MAFFWMPLVPVVVLSEVSWGFLLWFISKTPSVPIIVVWDFCILYCHPSPEWLDFSSWSLSWASRVPFMVC